MNSKGTAQSVDDLLTTRQLQDLLQVDRITIYRMLGDGRLRGFKIGGQWRFSRKEIEAWLQEQQRPLDVADMPPPPGGIIAPSPQSLPLSCILAIQGVCAEALDIATVTTDLDGTLLTKVSNSCDFCSLVLATEKGSRRCAGSWKQVDNGRIRRCHAGLLCVGAPVEVGGQWVAISSACQFAAPSPNGAEHAWLANLPALAADLGLAESDLRTAAQSVRVVPDASLPRISHLLRRMAGTFSEIGEERLNLLSRLQHIAEMSQI
jgi:excisionase family DNA binding protein